MPYNDKSDENFDCCHSLCCDDKTSLCTKKNTLLMIITNYHIIIASNVLFGIL